MTEQRSGLRFDIYERVHLADGTVGMKELDEVELVPHIQLFSEGEQAVLKGNLYLAGKYQGETGDESRTLEHFIPVEITLPINRIQDLNEVAVEIDNFDVDLISARSLNVTGVLTLFGIEMISDPEESWREEEETIFVHERQSGQAVEERPAKKPAVEEPAAEETLSTPVEDLEEVIANADYEDEVQAVFAEQEKEEPAQPPQENAIAAPEAEEEKNGLKIAFGSKPSNEQSFYLKSLIKTDNNRGSPSATAAQPDETDTSAQRAEQLEWKRLFVRGDGKETQFRRLRLCIVQKDETLEALSNRYNVSPREILFVNRLTEQDVTEGKVICIP